jgi:hypothetical protein
MVFNATFNNISVVLWRSSISGPWVHTKSISGSWVHTNSIRIRVDPGPRNRGPTLLLALKIRTTVANTGEIKVQLVYGV